MTTAVAGVVATCVVKHGNEEENRSVLAPNLMNPGGQHSAVVSEGSGKSEVGYAVHPDGHIPGE